MLLFKTLEDHHFSFLSTMEKQSHIYENLQNNLNCFNESNNKCFSILDSARTKFKLNRKEGMYIGWGNPDLNKQVKSMFLLH